MRQPTSGSVTASSNNDKVTKAVDDIREQMAGRLFNVFANYHFYSNVSNEAWKPQTTGYDSFEAIHDLIHISVGGKDGNGAGTMFYINLSAFDPSFWLHHA